MTEPTIRKAQVKWVENLRFLGMSPSGRAVVMDASPAVGGDGSAPTPAELVLVALGGCTGIDVVSILTKMRVPFRDLKVEVEGQPVAEHPRIYEWVRVTYRFIGVADQEKARRAVELSQQKYCSVSAIVSHSAKLSYQIVFED